jgi:hypothetical protein
VHLDGERSRDVLETAAIRIVSGHGTILAAPPTGERASVCRPAEAPLRWTVACSAEAVAKAENSHPPTSDDFTRGARP